MVSNIGYGILGHLIEQISGRNYADYICAGVFLPLGMTCSSVYLLPVHERRQAILYDFDCKPISAYTSVESASAMVYSGAHELACFAVFMRKNHRKDGRAILIDTSLDEISRELIFKGERLARYQGWADGYAIGLTVSPHGDFCTVGHGDAMLGVATVFTLAPEKNLIVIVAANTNGGAGRIPELLLKNPALMERQVFYINPRSVSASEACCQESECFASSLGGRRACL